MDPHSPDEEKQVDISDPNTNGSEGNQDPIQWCSSGPGAGVLPSIRTFTVQCGECFKWRLIPTKAKYEELREHILEQPFTCEVAKEWKPEIGCGDPGDIEQDGTRLWAIDKPNISKPPPGWDRQLRVRGEGGFRFADVYYIAPSGKKLRSLVEIQKYLSDHPDYIRQGVTMCQFSFLTPKPLQENYVKKRPARLADPGNESNLKMSGNDEPKQVEPLAWAPCDDETTLQLGKSPASDSHSRDPLLETPPVKKKARPSTQHLQNGDKIRTPPRVKIKAPRPPPDGVYDL